MMSRLVVVEYNYKLYKNINKKIYTTKVVIK